MTDGSATGIPCYAVAAASNSPRSGSVGGDAGSVALVVFLALLAVPPLIGTDTPLLTRPPPPPSRLASLSITTGSMPPHSLPHEPPRTCICTSTKLNGAASIHFPSMQWAAPNRMVLQKLPIYAVPFTLKGTAFNCVVELSKNANFDSLCLTGGCRRGQGHSCGTANLAVIGLSDNSGRPPAVDSIDPWVDLCNENAHRATACVSGGVLNLVHYSTKFSTKVSRSTK
jgi:hypothetical protein